MLTDAGPLDSEAKKSTRSKISKLKRCQRYSGTHRVAAAAIAAAAVESIGTVERREWDETKGMPFLAST